MWVNYTKWEMFTNLFVLMELKKLKTLSYGTTKFGIKSITEFKAWTNKVAIPKLSPTKDKSCLVIYYIIEAVISMNTANDN